jgi:hypothetical protein
MMQKNEIENTIVQALLADLPPDLEVLRTQYDKANVVEREFTGVGFFTSFVIPDSVNRIVPGNFQLEGFLTLREVLVVHQGSSLG